jgi:AraC-like DNA-binding protein/mannose-6-phosphate isomerase-like protein (cupin superfamily)
MSKTIEIQTDDEIVAALEALPRPVVAFANDYPAGHGIARHRHVRAQLLYAAAGVMRVATDRGVWVVPPQRAVWIPAGVEHEIGCAGVVRMRTLYVDPEAIPGLPEACRVVDVPPLLRELILKAATLPPLYDLDGADDRLMRVILDQIETLDVAPLHLPVPTHPRLAPILAALLAHPEDGTGLDAWGRRVGASGRTLARLFVAETGMTFGAWRQQARLLAALTRLAAGDPVTTVALDLGYDSLSAFIAMFRRATGTTPGRYFEVRR